MEQIPNTSVPTPAKGLSTAGMVLGIIAICIAWIPFVGLIAFIPATLAIIFGAIGLFKASKANAPKGIPITGLVTGIVSIILIFAMTGAGSMAVKKAIDESNHGSGAANIPSDASSSSDGNQASTQADDRKGHTISAAGLFSEYESNEVAADNNFKGKTFYVTGTIESIGKDLMDHPYVSLETGNAIMTVQCFFDNSDAVATLHKGQKVTLHGHGDGKLGNVFVKGCEVVPNE